MPVFEYRGVAAGNRTARGWIDAESLRAARHKLRAEGIFPTDLREGSTRSGLSEWLTRLHLPQLRDGRRLRACCRCGRFRSYNQPTAWLQ